MYHDATADIGKPAKLQDIASLQRCTLQILVMTEAYKSRWLYGQEVALNTNSLVVIQIHFAPQ